MLGVFYGCEYVSSTSGETIFSNTWQGSGADTNHPVKAFVYDDPNQLFAIATSVLLASPQTEALVRADVFKNVQMANGNSGSDTTGMSSAVADLSTIATTATFPLRILGIQDDPENSDFTVAGIPLIVRINAHFNAPVSTFDSQSNANSAGI